MGFINRMRRVLAHKIYKAPKAQTEDGILGERGIFEYALDTRVKRDVIRELAYHMGHRKFYSEDVKGSGIGVVGEYAIYDKEFPVSADKTDYDSMEEYLDTVKTAEREHIVECLRDCVEAKVIEFITEDGFTDDHTIDPVEVTGVRPGPRFEFAVQVLMFADRTANNMHCWNMTY